MRDNLSWPKFFFMEHVDCIPFYWLIDGLINWLTFFEDKIAPQVRWRFRIAKEWGQSEKWVFHKIDMISKKYFFRLTRTPLRGVHCLRLLEWKNGAGETSSNPARFEQALVIYWLIDWFIIQGVGWIPPLRPDWGVGWLLQEGEGDDQERWRQVSSRNWSAVDTWTGTVAHRLL